MAAKSKTKSKGKTAKLPPASPLVSYVARALGGHTPQAWKALSVEDRTTQREIARRAVGAVRRFEEKETKASK